MSKEDYIISIQRMLRTDPSMGPLATGTMVTGLRTLSTEALQILQTEIGHLYREAYRSTDNYPKTIKRRI